MDTIQSLQNVIIALRKESLEYQESQLRFKTVFEHSRLGNKIINPDLKILQVNSAMVALLGYDTKEELIGTKILDYAPTYCHKDWRFLQEKLWQKFMPSFSLETCLAKKDGTIIWCQITSIIFPDNGTTLGYTTIEDVTEKHKSRLQKEEFISVASHELKTPITSLKASLQLMNKVMKLNAPVTETIIKLSQNSERYVKKLNHLVEDLLNSNKIEQGELNLNKQTFTLSELIDDCCSHIRLEGKYNIIYEGDISLQLFADQQKIDQVVVNMVNNAVKYAPESLDILVGAQKIDNYIRITVTDKGPGISAEDVAHLFDRYFRAGNNATKTSGLGLGLYISAAIVKRHGGDIGVESTIGEGTTFWFTIPDTVN